MERDGQRWSRMDRDGQEYKSINRDVRNIQIWTVDTGHRDGQEFTGKVRNILYTYGQIGQGWTMDINRQY
jgi:hypothetical protein